MEQFRKMIAVVLTVAMAVSLGACGNDGAVSSSVAASAASSTEGGKMVNIGVAQLLTYPAMDTSLRGFKDGLTLQGFEEGKNVAYDIQNAQGEQLNCITIANIFVNKKLDLILATVTPAAQAVAKVIIDTPVMITAVTDPADAKLVASNEKLGGNVLGTSGKTPVKEQIEMLKGIMSDVQTVGIMYISSETNSQLQTRWAEAVCEGLGLKYQEFTISNMNEIQQAAQLMVGKVQAVYIPTDNILASGMENAAAVTNSAKLPLIIAEVGPVQNGGPYTVGIDYEKLGHQIGLMAARVFRGEVKPADMTIEYQTEYTISYNSVVAKQLGITLLERILKGEDVVAVK